MPRQATYPRPHSPETIELEHEAPIVPSAKSEVEPETGLEPATFSLER